MVAELAPFDPKSVPVRWSRLKEMQRSAAHYLDALVRPKEPTPAMRFGTLVHRQILGGEDVIVYGGDRRGNAWKDFAAANEGKFIVTAAEYERSNRCAQALREHPLASNLLVGNLELEVNWRLGDRACASHIDAAGWSWVSELKTTACAKPEWFIRHALGMGYHAQLAWYVDALEAATGRRIETAHVAAVETSAPYLVTVFTLTPRALEEGRKLNRVWFERLRVCEDSNVWPGYVESVVPFDTGEVAPTLLLPDGEEIAA